ncbi:CapA family protein [Patescibacteria group bacterium]
MLNIFQNKLKLWVVGLSVLAIAPISYIVFVYADHFLVDYFSEVKDRSLVLQVGVEESISEELLPIFNKFQKNEDIKIEFRLLKKNQHPDLDILFVNSDLEGETDLVGSLNTDSVIFANNTQKSTPNYIYSIVRNQFELTYNLVDFVKDEISREEITLFAVGDIMLSRHVGTKIFESGNMSLPFLATANVLKEADITFGNLESPFFDQGPRIKEGMVFKAEPATINGLIDSGFDILSLANNHFGNQGRAGMDFTYNYLLENNIQYVGAGKNFEQAHNLKVIEKKGIKFGFLAYNGIPPVSYQADVSTSGLAWMDTVQMQKDVQIAKKNCDVLILSMHAGAEYTPNPNTDQINFARSAVDAGVDLVIGHHPHVVQAYEEYNNGIIIYSLGNFVFDQMWSTETSQGMILKVIFSGNKLSIFEFIPIHIYNFNQPKILSDTDEANSILDRVYNANKLLPKHKQGVEL